MARTTCHRHPHRARRTSKRRQLSSRQRRSKNTNEMEIVMEFCAKGDLFTRMEGHHESKHFDEKEALCKFVEIAQGLHFLHKNDIAHRDLSLENVLLSDDGKCKISDFGLSTSTSRQCSERVGKSYYMALEVARGGCYDPVKADIWSLGVILFMMLTGSPLWDVETVSERVVESVASRGASWVVRSWGHSLMLATLDLLDRMLRVCPEERLSLAEILQHPVVVWAKRKRSES